jgi:Cu-Zn family superoxide dismutase
MRIAVLLPLSLASLGLAGTLSAQQVPAEKPQINRVTVELASASGQRATGTIVLSPDNHGLHLTGTVRGLKANSEHGFHVHENGDCSAADASSAGGTSTRQAVTTAATARARITPATCPTSRPMPRARRRSTFM